jgi:hypothetical protein
VPLSEKQVFQQFLALSRPDGHGLLAAGIDSAKQTILTASWIKVFCRIFLEEFFGVEAAAFAGNNS